MALYSAATFPGSWLSASASVVGLGVTRPDSQRESSSLFFCSSSQARPLSPLSLSLFLVFRPTPRPPAPVCGPDSGDTRAGFLAGDHGSLVGPMEPRKEYQLKGYEYLSAELFNNIRVGGPRDPQDESCGMINVTRLHKRHGRQECTV